MAPRGGVNVRNPAHVTTKKLPLTDFRAVRSKLEPHEFAVNGGEEVPPSELVDADVWDGIMHLPEDVSIRISDHNGARLRLMHQLWGDWVEAIGDPDYGPTNPFVATVMECAQKRATGPGRRSCPSERRKWR